MDEDTNSSSNSDDTNLTIDLSPNSDVDQHISEHSDHQLSDEDGLAIGCDEDEGSVNFYIIGKSKPKVQPKKRKKFVNKGKLTKHDSSDKKEKMDETTTEVSSKEYNCFVCEFATRGLSYLYSHLHQWHQEDHNKCGFQNCAYLNKSEDSVFEHAKFHGLENCEDMFTCPKCSFRTDTWKKILIHMKTRCKHSQPDDIVAFFCPLCPVSMKTYPAIIHHFKSHAIDNKYLRNIVSCPMCRAKTKRTRFGNHAKHHVSAAIHVRIPLDGKD